MTDDENFDLDLEIQEEDIVIAEKKNKEKINKLSSNQMNLKKPQSKENDLFEDLSSSNNQNITMKPNNPFEDNDEVNPLNSINKAESDFTSNKIKNKIIEDDDTRPSPLLSLDENKEKIMKVKNNENSNNSNVNSSNDSTISYSNSSKFKEGPVISWKEEALKGNFMPAIVLLEKNQININEIVNPDNEERLIHIAVTCSFLNVTRCFIEKYKADINIKNKFGHTPLHIICNNTSQDLFLLSYFLNQAKLEIEAVDNTNVTPYFYTVMSGFKTGMMSLVSKGANINHIDKYTNSVLYLATSFGNKFAFRFMQNHSEVFNINTTYFQDDTTLADVLLHSKHKSICKYLMKHYHQQINMNSLVSCGKEKKAFKSINHFNYEMMKTTFFYKCYGSVIGLFKVLLEIKNYNYKTYMLTFFVYDLALKNMNNCLRYIMILLYCLLTVIVYFSFFDQFYFHSPVAEKYSDLKIISLDTLKMIYQLSSIVTLIVALMKFISIWYYNTSNNNEISSEDIKRKQYLYSNDKENIINEIREAIDNDPLTLPIENEFCEVCLIKKDDNVVHCSEINSCVEKFHFFSKLLNICVSKSTVIYYLMFINSIIGMNIAILFNYYYIIDFESHYNKYGRPDTEFGRKNLDQYNSIYISENISFNVFIFLSELSLKQLSFVFYLFIVTLSMLQTACAILISFGYGSSYYFLWKLHKPVYNLNLKLRDGKRSIVNVCPGPGIGLKKFFYNIWNSGLNDNYENEE